MQLQISLVAPREANSDVLHWLRVWPELRTPLLRGGFVLLHAQCAIFATAYGWLALR